MVRATFDRTIFEEWIAGMNTAATQVLAEPTKAIDVVCKNVGLTDEHRESLLSYLMAPQDPLTEGGTVWGMVNGINRLAHGLGADEEARLERAAGEVLATADKLFVLR